MATKPKSNVAKSAKKSSFKFRWWMAVIGIGVIAVIGIAIVRFSNASSVTNQYADKVTSTTYLTNNIPCMRMQSSGTWCWQGEFQSGLHKHIRTSDGRCAFMATQGTKGSNLGSAPAGTWVTISETTNCGV